MHYQIEVVSCYRIYNVQFQLWHEVKSAWSCSWIMALGSTVIETPLLIIGIILGKYICQVRYSSWVFILVLLSELNKLSVLETLYQGTYQDLKDLREKLYFAGHIPNTSHSFLEGQRHHLLLFWRATSTCSIYRTGREIVIPVVDLSLNSTTFQCFTPSSSGDGLIISSIGVLTVTDNGKSKC